MKILILLLAVSMMFAADSTPSVDSGAVDAVLTQLAEVVALRDLVPGTTVTVSTSTARLLLHGLAAYQTQASVPGGKTAVFVRKPLVKGTAYVMAKGLARAMEREGIVQVIEGPPRWWVEQELNPMLLGGGDNGQPYPARVEKQTWPQ